MGVRADCKECFAKLNKEKKKAYEKAYRETNKEKMKAYREVNKEKIKAYREANKEKRKAYNEAYVSEEVNNLSNHYIISAIICGSPLKRESVTQDMIDLKRTQIRIKRFIRDFEKKQVNQ